MITPIVTELSRVSPHRRQEAVPAVLLAASPAPDRTVAPAGQAPRR